MCYYNGIKVTHLEFIRLKDLEKSIKEFQDLLRPVQSGFDYGNSIVVTPVAGQHDMKVSAMEWGFLPSYISTREKVQQMRLGYKDASGKFHPPLTTLNAIGEEMLLPNKIYRDAALHRRCLVPSTGFYEWRHINPIGKNGKELKTAIKYPYHIEVKDKQYFYMAAIWQPWTDKSTGEHVNTFALVTTAENPLMRVIHNSKYRMPTILTEDLAEE